eukprot:3032298-Prymnesium_polylepis.1
MRPRPAAPRGMSIASRATRLPRGASSANSGKGAPPPPRRARRARPPAAPSRRPRCGAATR